MIYSFPPPPPRTRTKPIRLLCVGLPRSGTESLSQALTQLGYTTFHGWDIFFDSAAHIQAWAALAHRKYASPDDSAAPITRADFDALLAGDCDAVLDTAPALFAPEMIQAYPEAKVILNTRRDLDAWQRSAWRAFVTEGADSWTYWLLHWFSAEVFWRWRLYYVVSCPGLFRGRTTGEGLRRHGKRVYREHGWMVKGLVSPERLLEWTVEDGWAGLCEFLDKEIPDQPFPHTNTGNGFRKRVQQILRPEKKKVLVTMVLSVISAGVLGSALVLG
ncbi:sulfotransferase family protein, partial [Aspergillus saccharolyticus JOP 1030-1]